VKYLNIPEALEAVKKETKVSVVEWVNGLSKSNMVVTTNCW
jgi:hypothetical protein